MFMPTMVKDTTTLGTALEDMDNELESMLDMISESLDFLRRERKMKLWMSLLN